VSAREKVCVRQQRVPRVASKPVVPKPNDVPRSEIGRCAVAAGVLRKACACHMWGKVAGKVVKGSGVRVNKAA